MAAEKDSSCHNNCINDPNFAIICSFFDRFAGSCGITHPTFSELQDMIENCQEVPTELIDLHVKLLRKIRRSVATEKWERALIKFCHSYYCNEEGWELERGGYKKCKVPIRLRILKTLLDAQFDLNSKFKTDINKLSAEELRLEPLGRDKVGQSYWCQFDSAANVRVYREDQDEETWKLVAKDREGLVDLITQLSSGEELLGLELINEDSNSQEVEKPIIDTGQVEMSTSEENTADNSSSIDSNLENNVKNEEQFNSNNYPENESCVEVKINNVHTGNQSDITDNNNSEKELVEFSLKETVESIENASKENAEDNDCSKNVLNLELESVQTNKDKSNLTSSNLESNELTEENSIEKCKPVTENETDHNKSLSIEIDNNYISQVSKTDRIDVTEEIKQRSLFKSNSLSVFKGKVCKPSLVSKLDKIFSHKLESCNIISADSSNNITELSHIAEQRLEVPHIIQPTKEDEGVFHKVTIQNIELPDNSDCKRKDHEFKNSLESHHKKQCLGTELSEEVGEEIEEPVMLIKGEGSGQDCNTGNHGRETQDIGSTEIFSDEVEEEIEEPIMIIRGEGNGQDCDTGNPSREGEDDVGATEKINIVTSSKIVLKNIANEQQHISSDNQKSSNDNSNDDGRVADIDSITCVAENNDENKDVLVNDIDNTEANFKVNESICKDIKTLSVNNKLEDKQVDSKIVIDSQIDFQSDVEQEKSIEEQLCFITGESFSKTECNEENSGYSMNNYSDKGSRRKSKEYTSLEDKDAIPPEAKKTKVGKDRYENFDCLDTNSTQTSDIIDTLMGKRDNSTDNKLNNPNLEVNSEELSRCNSQIINDVNSEKENESKRSQDISFEKKFVSAPITNLDVEEGTKELTSSNSKIINNEGSEMENANKNSQESSTLTINQLSENEKKNHKMAGNNKKSFNKKTAKTKSIKDTSNRHIEINDSKSNKLGEKVSLIQENIVLKESPIGSCNAIDIDTSSAMSGKETFVNVTGNCLTVPDNSHLNTENNAKTAVTVKQNKIEEESKNETNLLKNEIESRTDNSILKCDKKEKPLSKKATPKKSPKPRRKIFTPKSRKRITRVPENSFKKETITENSLENKNTIQSKKKGGRKGDSNPKISEEKQNTTKSESQMEVIDDTMTKYNSAIKENRKRRSSRRNTGTEKDSEEDAMSDKKEEDTKEDGEEVEIGGKRRKIKGKRAPNKALRKTIEEKRKSNSSSEEESKIQDTIQHLKKSPPSPKQKHGKGKNTVKNIGKKNITTSDNKNKEDDESSNETEEIVQTNKKNKTSKTLGRNSRAFLGIDLNIDINETSRSVRQSSRLAQIKIKEQADNKIVDERHQTFEKFTKKSSKKRSENEEKQKGTPKKQKKPKTDVSEDDIQEEEALTERKKKRRKKKKHPVKAFNERDPWKSSSGSSSEAEDEEEEYHFDDIVEDEEDIPVAIKSDHEFSPESDLEGDDEVKPIRHARTAQKVSDPSAEEGDADDFACEKCGKKDHPEWILLCDTCDHGWHASCLRPSLMLIPEGDWYCPTCQHAVLVKKLQETLKIFDRDSKRRENEELRKKRLAYVGISLDNVLPSNVHAHHPREAREKMSASESSESSESDFRSESEESDEPVYQLRQRRQGTNTYRFSEFDELINSAIQDEVAGKHAVFGIVPENVNQTTEKIEGELSQTENKDKELKEIDGLEESKPPTSCDEKKEVIDKPIKKNKEKSDEDEESSSEDEDNEDEGEEEFPHVVPKRINTLARPGKKKHRRLNCLDDASDDDDGSDEDFKGSSSEEEEEDEEEDDSDESGTGRRRSKRGHIGPVRRSSRTRRSRFDKEFINDDSEESDAPRRKKTKKLWSESDSESDDSTWGRRKKKKKQGSSGRRRFKKNKKFVIEDELSETETSKVPKKKRQRKVKYGGLDDLSVEDLPSRRTRGRKINYQEVLGSDSDEEIQKPKNIRKPIINDDEFVAEKEEKRDSESSSTGEDEDGEVEQNSCDAQSNEEKITDKKSLDGEIQKKELTKIKASPLMIPPVDDINKEKFGTVKKVKPPKAMIAPPPERLISEDEQYKAIVSKVSTLTHSEKSSNESDIKLVRPINFNDHSNSSSESKDFAEHPHHLTPIKIQNSSVDQKFIKRSPPIKIRSGVPVNAAGRRSPLASPTSEISFFPVKQINLEQMHSPPDKIQLQSGPQKRQGVIQATAQQFVSARKSVDSILKTEKLTTEDIDNADEDDYLDDIEEEEDDDEDDSEDDVLEEGEIPKKVARRMARMEERILRQEEVRLTSQAKPGKPVQPAAPLSPGAVQPPTSSASEQKPTQPLLRVVSPLKLMANPPGPLQSSFIHSGMATRMPLSSPPGPSRMAMAIRPPQPTNMMPGITVDDGSPKKRGRGRGKKQQEKPEQEMMGGGSVIRGMLQQPQSYPPTHYSQQYPPHPRIPFNPQRMPRPPFHPGHHPLDPSPSGGGTVIKQEPVSNPAHIPNKPPPSSVPPFHPTAGPPHRFDSALHRQPNYPPQPPKSQYNSYPHPPGPSTNYHYGNYPPPLMTQREEPQGYPVQQPYNEQYTEHPAAPAASSNKTFPEDDSGEFGGLVSYFSSQREEELDT